MRIAQQLYEGVDIGDGSVGLITPTMLIKEDFQDVTVDGVMCANQSVLSSFCESPLGKAKSKCVGCLPRGDYDTYPYPAVAAFASVRNQVFRRSDIASVSNSIETGVHSECAYYFGQLFAWWY